FDKMAISLDEVKPNGGLKRAGFMPTNPGWWNWSWAYFFGSSLYDGHKLTIDTPENLKAFEWIKWYTDKLGREKMTEFQSSFGNFSSPLDPFMTGQVATELNGVWKGNYIKTYKPDLKWFAVPFPYPDDKPELAGHGMISEDILVIPRGAHHVK